MLYNSLDIKGLVSLILLMALLPESRHKVDTDRVVFIALVHKLCCNTNLLFSVYRDVPLM